MIRFPLNARLSRYAQLQQVAVGLTLLMALLIHGCATSAPATPKPLPSAPPLSITSPWGESQATLTLSNAKLALLVIDPNQPMNDVPRFDRSGVVAYAVTDDGRSLFGPTVPVDQHDRSIGHHIAGTAEEFDLDGPVSFTTAAPGEPFVKIGVGVLRRSDAEPYNPGTGYQAIDLTPWRIERFPDRLVFTQELDAVESTGVAYTYRKTVILDNDGRGFRIERQLTNHGNNTIDTLHYNHQYLILNGQPAGDGYRLDADQALAPGDPFRDRNYEYGDFVEGDFVFADPPDPGRSLWGRLIREDGQPLDHFRLWFDPAAQGVSVRSDRPWERFMLFTLPPAISPEGFTRLMIEPTHTARWSLSYRLLEHIIAMD